MSVETDKDNWDGVERRSGDDRRQNERRDGERNVDSGVLTTRTAQRRQELRRNGDLDEIERKDTQ